VLLLFFAQVPQHAKLSFHYPSEDMSIQFLQFFKRKSMKMNKRVVMELITMNNFLIKTGIAKKEKTTIFFLK